MPLPYTLPEKIHIASHQLEGLRCLRSGSAYQILLRNDLTYFYYPLSLSNLSVVAV